MQRILILAFIASLSSWTPVWAQATPQHAIDLTKLIMDENGKPMRDQFQASPEDPTCQKCVPLTVGHAISHALLAVSPADQTTTLEQKWARGVLALKIKDSNQAEFSSEEIVVIKRAVGAAYGPLVIVQLIPLLDPNAQPPKLQ